MIKTDYDINGEKISYEISEDGYDIYLGDKIWVTQHEPYILYPSLGYEGSCLKQIEDICKPAEEMISVDKKIEEMKQYISKLEKELSVQSDAIAAMSESLYTETK